MRWMVHDGVYINTNSINCESLYSTEHSQLGSKCIACKWICLLPPHEISIAFLGRFRVVDSNTIHQTHVFSLRSYCVTHSTQYGTQFLHRKTEVGIEIFQNAKYEGCNLNHHVPKPNRDYRSNGCRNFYQLTLNLRVNPNQLIPFGFPLF